MQARCRSTLAGPPLGHYHCLKIHGAAQNRSPKLSAQNSHLGNGATTDSGMPTRPHTRCEHSDITSPTVAPAAHAHKLCYAHRVQRRGCRCSAASPATANPHLRRSTSCSCPARTGIAVRARRSDGQILSSNSQVRQGDHHIFHTRTVHITASLITDTGTAGYRGRACLSLRTGGTTSDTSS